HCAVEEGFRIDSVRQHAVTHAAIIPEWLTRSSNALEVQSRRQISSGTRPCISLSKSGWRLAPESDDRPIDPEIELRAAGNVRSYSRCRNQGSILGGARSEEHTSELQS